MDVNVKKHNQYKLVDINHCCWYKKYESFILEMQATQICYVPYPSQKKDKDDWLAVLKVKPRNVIELPIKEVVATSELNVSFQVEVHEIDMSVSFDENILLHDPNGGVLEINEPLNVDMTRGGYRVGWNLLQNAPVPLHYLSKVKLIPMGSTRKNFYWDASVSEEVVQQQWLKKAALCYKNFISNINKHRAIVQLGFVNDHVWEKWMELWESDDCIKKSEIYSKNHYGGREVAAGTHTGGSITVGKHRKKLALKIGRDPTPSELHLHVHTHNHDGKSFVATRGAKKKRLFGLRSEAGSYHGKKLCACDTSSSSIPPSIFLPTTNLEEFVKQLISALTAHFILVVIEHVGGIRVQEGVVLDPPPTNDDDDGNVDS
ncbi:hypothetical protein P3L10_013367 [Capsicum annuum]|uniref:uncharacterized protein LOC124897999 n=1 Tax=Capsicum annuum TaxID=4072 RepID=UPI001FB18A5F|nr:uncharacterized protein LOC124897999 [Capsicum annuum]